MNALPIRDNYTACHLSVLGFVVVEHHEIVGTRIYDDGLRTREECLEHAEAMTELSRALGSSTRYTVAEVRLGE